MKKIFAIAKNYIRWELTDDTGSEWWILSVKAGGNGHATWRSLQVRKITHSRAHELIRLNDMKEVLKGADGVVYELPEASLRAYCREHNIKYEEA